MPPLLGARTCWCAGWAVIGLGVVLIVVSNSVASSIFVRQGPGTLAQTLYLGLNAVVYMMPLAGMVLLIGSLVLRHVERLTGALVDSGVIEAPAPPHGAEHRPGRRTDGDVDLHDLHDDLDGVVEHEPGVR